MVCRADRGRGSAQPAGRHSEDSQPLLESRKVGYPHSHCGTDKKVADCVAWSGRRPIEWLLENQAVDQRWCLVHATHATETEVRDMAASGAIVGLCPITEATWATVSFPRRRSWSRVDGLVSGRIRMCCWMGLKSFVYWNIRSASLFAHVTCWRPLRDVRRAVVF